MKFISSLFLTFLLAPTVASSKTIIFESLDNVILHSDVIFVGRITAGKCVEPGCKESRPHLVRKDYNFTCDKIIIGKCPKVGTFRSGSSLKIGTSYLLMQPRDNGGRTFFSSLELEYYSNRVIFSGNLRPLQDLTLKSERSDIAPMVSQHYYDYDAFIRIVKKLKSDPRLNN